MPRLAVTPPRPGRAALPEGAGQLRDGGDGGEAGRRVRGDVRAGGRGLRGRNGAMHAPPERGRDRGVQRCPKRPVSFVMASPLAGALCMGLFGFARGLAIVFSVCRKSTLIKTRLLRSVTL